MVFRKQQIAPMAITPLLTLLPDDLSQQINDIIALKATMTESTPITIDPKILLFIEQSMIEIKESLQAIDEQHFKADKLDYFFIQTLMSLK
ncbi:MAG: hypothetical protein J6583_00940 [Gilliamella sp.]|nr:hypothetical protein [Gilliamella sp.]